MKKQIFNQNGVNHKNPLSQNNSVWSVWFFEHFNFNFKALSLSKEIFDKFDKQKKIIENE